MFITVKTDLLTFVMREMSEINQLDPEKDENSFLCNPIAF